MVADVATAGGPPDSGAQQAATARRSLLSATITDLATGLMGAPTSRIDSAIRQALQDLCHAVDGDRARLSAWDSATNRLLWREGWAKQGLPTGPLDASLDLSQMPAWQERARDGINLEVRSATALPEDDLLRQAMIDGQVGSLIAIPLLEEERCTGYLVVESVGHESQWSLDEFSALTLAADLFSNSAMRRGHEAALERALEDAHNAMRAKDAFLATISHELRTPMNGITGTAQLLADGPLLEGQRPLIEALGGSARRMQRTIEDLIDFASLEAGNGRNLPEPVAIRPFLDDLLRRFGASDDARPVALRSSVSAGVPASLMIDLVGLSTILSHLIGNALRHAGRGTVSVLAEAAEGRLRLTVADTGCGMSPSLVQRLFRPFEQADASHARSHDGLGLGLAICDRACRLLGGSIRVESEVGSGTRVQVDLPLVIPERPEDDGREAARQPAAPSLPGITALVVEDNQVNQLVVVNILRRIGCSVDVAKDGIEAVQKVLARPYQIVFMDIQMPRMDGIAATRAIRGREDRDGLPRMPIVGLTCLGLAEDRERGLLSGMDAYLTKPVGPDDIVQAIAQHARRDSCPPGAGARPGACARSAVIFAAEPQDLRGVAQAFIAAGLAPHIVRLASEGFILLAQPAGLEAPLGVAVAMGNLPDMPAETLVRALHAMPGLDALPVILVGGGGQRAPDCISCAAGTSPGDLAALASREAHGTTAGRVAGEAPTGQAAADAEVLTDGYLRQAEALAPGSIQPIVSAMLADLEKAHSDLPRLAAEPGRIQDLRKLAHSLKGASGSIGAMALSRSSARLEMAIRSGERDGVGSLAQDLGREIGRLRSVLHERYPGQVG